MGTRNCGAGIRRDGNGMIGSSCGEELGLDYIIRGGSLPWTSIAFAMRFSTLIPLCLSFASAAIAQAVTYEAENGVRVGTTVLSELAGFSGTGYVGGFDESSDSVTFTVHSTGQKLYELSVRYAGIYGSKYTRMVLNNASGGDISLPESTGWETASGGKVLLKDGANTIKLENNWGWYVTES